MYRKELFENGSYIENSSLVNFYCSLRIILMHPKAFEVIFFIVLQISLVIFSLIIDIKNDNSPKKSIELMYLKWEFFAHI